MRKEAASMVPPGKCLAKDHLNEKLKINNCSIQWNKLKKKNRKNTRNVEERNKRNK